MAVSLEATIGGSSSNSYVTLARGNDIMDYLPHAEDWRADFTISKSVLLIHATRLIDRHFRFSGEKATSTQALEWPRSGVKHPDSMSEISSTIIPDFIEWATVEWAYQLYLDDDVGGASFAPGLTRLRTPSYEAEFRGSTKSRIPQVVNDLLLDYGRHAPRGMIRLMRA